MVSHRSYLVARKLGYSRGDIISCALLYDCTGASLHNAPVQICTRLVVILQPNTYSLYVLRVPFRHVNALVCSEPSHQVVQMEEDVDLNLLRERERDIKQLEVSENETSSS